MKELKNIDDLQNKADTALDKYKKAQMRNLSIVLCIALLIVGIFLFDKWNSVASEDYIDGNVLRIAASGAPTTGLPWKVDSFVTQLTFAGLFETDSSMKQVNPYLAEKYTVSPDGLTYTITLHENLKWSDGSDLTVDDVVWSIETFMLSPGTNTNIVYAFANILGCEEWQEVGFQSWENGGTHSLEGVSTNGNDIIITLDTAYNQFPVALTQFVILPKEHLQHLDPTTFATNIPVEIDEFFRDPVCSGMYRAGGLTEDGDLELVHNEYYSRTPSDIEKVIMCTDYNNTHLGYYTTNNVTEMTSYRAMTGFQEFTTDVEWYRYFMFNFMAGFDQPNMIPQLDEDGNEVVDSDGNVVLVEELVEYGEDREQNYPMQDLKLRQAISLALDRQTLADEVYIKTATYDFATTGNAEYSEFLTDYNPELAKQLLAESNYDLSRPLTIGYYHSDTNTAAYLDRVKTYLEDVGFTVIVKKVSGSVNLYERREYDFYLKAYSAYSTIEWYNEYLTSNLLINGLLGIDEYDELLSELGSSTSLEQYSSLMNELQELDASTMYKIPLLSLKDAVYIDGNRVSVPADMEFGNVRLRYDLRLDEWYIKKG